jgi:hypothetical protein
MTVSILHERSDVADCLPLVRCALAVGAGMAALHLLPQSAGYAITSDLVSVVCSPSRMASCFISNVSEVQP